MLNDLAASVHSL